MKKSLSTILFLYLCITFTFVSAKDYGGTLVVGYKDKIESMNPLYMRGTVASGINLLVYNRLVNVTSDGKVVPELAKSWEVSPDKLNWTFYLRKGVKFHDGHELTAEDVKFTYSLLMDNELISIYKGKYRLISNVEVIDKYCIKFYLTKLFSNLFYDLASYYIGILPQHLYSREIIQNNKENFIPVGTGPFKFLKQTPEGKIILKEDHISIKLSLHIIRIFLFSGQNWRPKR